MASTRLTTQMWAAGQRKASRADLYFWLGQHSTFTKTANTERREEIEAKRCFFGYLSWGTCGIPIWKCLERSQKTSVGEN